MHDILKRQQPEGQANINGVAIPYANGAFPSANINGVPLGTGLAAT